ncbi:DUF928 domain-containing protein [Pleurocapsales cyanobacterium LEGE 10410]|nr:DUF928 domain-containing protein [Pleurocapsales cyanobacterium LEGE 10410]
MLNIKFISSKSYSFFSLIIVLNFVLLGFADSAIAKQKKGTSKVTNSNYGLPTHRRDGGSRGSGNNCVANAEQQNLVALIPDQTVGISSSASPQLFFYVPEINSQKTLEFVLRNEQDELLYEADLTTEGKGIISIEVPDSTRSNSSTGDRNYHWYLSIICDQQQRSRDIVVEGWVRQKAIDLATSQQLDSAGIVEKAEIYSNLGFWYDALSVLAQNEALIAEQPMVREKWTELLKSVGLQELASESFIETKPIKNSASF